MKNFRIKKRISDYLNRNKWQILIVFASLFAGIIIGSFFSVRMSVDKSDATATYIQNFISAYGLQSVNKGEIFKFSLYNNIKLVVFLWFSGLWVGLLPFGLVQVGLKGYKIGFSTAIFVKIFGIRGVLFAFLSVLPQILFMLPTVIVYSVFNINFAFTLRNIRFQRTSGNIKNQLYIKNLIFLVVAVLIAIIAGLVDAYIVPPILKPICSLINK